MKLSASNLFSLCSAFAGASLANADGGIRSKKEAVSTVEEVIEDIGSSAANRVHVDRLHTHGESIDGALPVGDGTIVSLQGPSSVIDGKYEALLHSAVSDIEAETATSGSIINEIRTFKNFVGHAARLNNVQYNRFSHPVISGPIIFAMPGRNTPRSQLVRSAEELAARGYTVISFDHLYPDGRRNSKTREGVHYPNDMWQAMKNSRAEIGWMIDNPAQFLEGLANPTTLHNLKFGVYGISMGGHTAQLAFKSNDKIDACAAVVSAGNYKDYIARKHINNNEHYSWSDYFPRDFDSDEVHQNESNVFSQNKPFLMFNDWGDSLVPPITNIHMVEDIRRRGYYAGKHSDQLELFLDYTGMGHNPEEERYQETTIRIVNWLEDHFPVNRIEEEVVPNGTFKISLNGEFKNGKTGTKHFLFHGTPGYLRAASGNWLDLNYLWKVSSTNYGYTIRNDVTSRYICASSSSTSDSVPPGQQPVDGSVGWVWTPMNTQLGEFCYWDLTHLGDGKYSIINKGHQGKLIFSTIKDDYGNYKPFTSAGKSVVHEWERGHFTIHKMNG